MTRLLVFLYSVICYVLFLAVSVWLTVFLLDIGGFRSGGAPTSWPVAVVIDLVLVAAFGVVHSVMARPWFKEVWTRIIPPDAERATYVLQSSAFFGFIFWQWRPIPVTIWEAHGWIAAVILCVSASGVVVIVTSTFLLGHFEFVGLRQAWDHLRRNPPLQAQFRTPLLYRLVRHPLQSGILIILFATPHMTADHLLFAMAMLAYMAIGLWFEERALLREFGVAYADYRRTVPMLTPRFPGLLGRGYRPGHSILVPEIFPPEEFLAN